MASRMEYVLWEWNVRVHSFDEQVAAAVAGGFDVLTLPYRKYLQEVSAKRTAKDLAQYAADKGVRLDFLDGMSGWSPVRYPPGADEFLKGALDYGAEEAFELCHAAGLRHIVAIAGFLTGALPHAQLVESFGRFCENAAQAGIWVDLEPMPMMGLPTLRSGWDIVRDADCANSGLLLDTWHFLRGAPDMELLARIPRGRIVNIQIVDGTREPGSTDLWYDAMHCRELPGEGELPIGGILSTLHQHQDLRSAGPEALSDKLDKLPAVEAGELAGRRTRTALATAGF